MEKIDLLRETPKTVLKIVGGNLQLSYSTFTKEGGLIAERPFKNKEVWVQTYSTLNSNRLSSRITSPTNECLIFTFKIKKEGESLSIEFPSENLSFRYGQYHLPTQTLKGVTSFSSAYDLILDTNYNTSSSFSKIMKGDTSLTSFCERYRIGTPFQEATLKAPVEPLCKTEFGYSFLRSPLGFSPTLEGYEGYTSMITSQLDDNCFTWVDSVADLPSRESSVIIDFRTTIDKRAIEEWVKSAFDTKTVDVVMETFGRNYIEVSLVAHPPTLRLNQFRNPINIVKPTAIAREKVVDSIIFEVGRSLVKNSSHFYRIEFVDNKTGTTLFEDSSLENPTNFLLKVNGVEQINPIAEPENSVFENNSAGVSFERPYRVTYKVPPTIVEQLASHLDYKIKVKISDLVSERE